jgi:hypothetical protein
MTSIINHLNTMTTVSVSPLIVVTEESGFIYCLDLSFSSRIIVSNSSPTMKIFVLRTVMLHHGSCTRIIETSLPICTRLLIVPSKSSSISNFQMNHSRIFVDQNMEIMLPLYEIICKRSMVTTRQFS